MILIMTAVSMIPLILLAYISLTVSGATVEQQVNRLNAQLVNQVIDRIELTMYRFRELSDQYSRNTSIESALIPPSILYFDEVVRKRDLINVLSTASAVIGNVEGLQVYSAVTGEVLSSKLAPSKLQDSPYRSVIERFLASGQSSLFLDKTDMPDLPLLEQSTYYIGRIPFDRIEELKGVLIISMDNAQFQGQIDNIQLGARGSISLLTPEGLTVATTSKLPKEEDERRTLSILEAWRHLGKPEQFALDSSIISVKQTSTYDQWIAVSEIPSKELTESTGVIRKTVMIFLGVLTGLGILAIILFGYQLYRPLQAIKKQVDALKKGRFDARVTGLANNEIGDLGRMLNSMADRIQELLSDLQESEDLKRRLEIRALQSQINPHFMYNTLNTIRMFAMLKDFDKINSLMGRLVSLLRYSMENFDQAVRLQQELVYLEDYLELLNMRYKCQISLQVFVEPSYKDMLIPKLSLQPIIENAVFHGILPKKMPEGLITVKVYGLPEGNRVAVEIGDNGVGMEEERLESLKTHMVREEIGGSIGLQNVWLRLRLHFGKAAEVEFRSLPGDGLWIRFLLPDTHVLAKEVSDGEL